MIEERLQIKKLWTIRKYAGDAAFHSDQPFELQGFLNELALAIHQLQPPVGENGNATN